MESGKIMKTARQIIRQDRDLAVFHEYNYLLGKEGQSKTAIIRYLMWKWSIKSPTTIYNILRRVRHTLKIE